MESVKDSRPDLMLGSGPAGPISWLFDYLLKNNITKVRETEGWHTPYIFLYFWVWLLTGVVLFTTGFWFWTVERNPGQVYQLGYEAFFCLLMDTETQCLQKISVQDCKYIHKPITKWRNTTDLEHTNQ